MKKYIGNWIWYVKNNDKWYVSGGSITIHTKITRPIKEPFVADKANTPSKALLDLYWLVGTVGHRDNENLANKLRKL